MSSELITTAAIGLLANNILGPTSKALGNDLLGAYQQGKRLILEKTKSKIKNKDKDSPANLRTAYETIINGGFSDSEVAAEYFSGILADSKREQGTNDRGVYFSNIVKSLSSKQLLLHYLLYSGANNLYRAEKLNFHARDGAKLGEYNVYFSTAELLKGPAMLEGADIGFLLHSLHSAGLLEDLEVNQIIISEEKQIPFHYTRVKLTPLGIQLYALVNNHFDQWDSFSSYNFGTVSSMKIPRLVLPDLEKIKKIGEETKK